MRGLAIALFYALGTTVGGTAAPAVFGHLIGTDDRFNLFYGYLFASALLAVAVGGDPGLRRSRPRGASLESVADPLSKVADVAKD